MSSAISVSKLKYSYSKNSPQVLKGVDLEISMGQSFGLLGPNGAGKTTLLSCLCGQLTDFKGSISILGEDIHRLGKGILQIGFAPQELALYPSLSVLGNLDFFASLSGLSGKELQDRVQWGLEFSELSDVKYQKVDTLSGGLKRRLNLAIAIINKPKILILDEPTVGVDPQTRNHIFEKVEELKKQGMTIVYTTHYMEEVERLCESVAIVDKGQILFCGTLQELKVEQGSERLEQCYLDLTSPKEASL